MREASSSLDEVPFFIMDPFFQNIYFYYTPPHFTITFIIIRSFDFSVFKKYLSLLEILNS